MSFSCNVSHADTFHPHLMMCTNMTTILSHQEDLGPSMLDVKYEGLGGTGLVTTPLNMAPNLSECNAGLDIGYVPAVPDAFFRWSGQFGPQQLIFYWPAGPVDILIFFFF